MLAGFEVGGWAMAADNPLAVQVMQALARGDKLGALQLMRQAGGPAMRQVLQEFQAQAAAQGVKAKSVEQAKQLLRNDVESVGRTAQRKVDASAQLLFDRKRPPTVAMGDPPGSMRWLLALVAVLLAAAWLAFGAN
ncbi:MAG: hypothetical protein EOP93_04195 [Lysobacteraceae bacterium]|nr:MAG: hypothetical protein EOP93_04195 [Xanthomonadaceae bacterium]